MTWHQIISNLICIYVSVGGKLGFDALTDLTMTLQTFAANVAGIQPDFLPFSFVLSQVNVIDEGATEQTS